MKSVSQNFKLLLGDITEQSKNIVEDSIDLIFTDPPYGFRYLYLYEELGKLASRLLKEGGSILMYVPHAYLDKILLDIFTPKKFGLNWYWILCVKQHGNHSIVHGKNLFIMYKPLLWYVKGKLNRYTTKTISDYIDSQKPVKALHDWEQSLVEAAHIIKHLTVENQIVLDPFMGSGTTGEAALKLNRKFIGIDIDAISYSTTQKRLSSIKEISK